MIVEEVKVNIFNIVGYGECTLPEDGDKVYFVLKKALDEGKKIVISFKNVNKVTTAFLNNAIGKLYSEYDESKIKESLSLEEMSDSNKVRLKRVVINAKNYFNNPDKMRESIKKILDENDE